LFSALAVTEIPNKDFFMPSAAQVLSRSYFSASNGKQDNITDWALKQFEKRYGKTKAKPITKDAIFHYVYGVLHDPDYREKYAQNLKREFPRLPFYPDFWSWADWGDKLMRLHIGFEIVDPWPLVRVETPDPRARAAGVAPKPILKSLPADGIIKLDSETTLTGIPPEAFAYRLGNRSGLDWILDQYKEKTPKDPTIREKFNTYRFADYKEKVIDLLARVTRVSVETMAITNAMKEAKR
jgi:predicted helicase